MKLEKSSAITRFGSDAYLNLKSKHMKRPVPFTKAQVRRAVEAAESAGMKVRGVTIAPDGSITINSGEKPAAAVDGGQKALADSWDDF